MRLIFTFFAVFSFVPLPRAVLADVLVLKHGGRVQGEITQSGDAYRVQLLGGLGELTFDAGQVERVVRETAVERKYRQLLAKMPDTAIGHWQMAMWCRRNELGRQRKEHLEHVLRHDPNHEEARRALGYWLVDAEWINRAELMRRRGYVLHDGRWRLEQEVHAGQEKNGGQEAVQQWRVKIRRWRSLLGKNREPEVFRNLKQVDDPAATTALVNWYQRETRADVRHAIIRTLGRVPSPAAISLLITSSIKDDNEETRLLCLDQLENNGRDAAIESFISGLLSNDNVIVRRAAVGLARMQAKNAIPQLIAALITVHRVAEKPPPTGRIGATFGQGPNGASGNGLSLGAKPKPKRRPIRNREALDALLSLTKNVNFEYDQRRWKDWHIRDSVPSEMDLRRGA